MTHGYEIFLDSLEANVPIKVFNECYELKRVFDIVFNICLIKCVFLT